MIFINATGCPADLLRSEHKGDQLANALLVRVRYRVEDQLLVLMAPDEQPDDLRRMPVDLGDYGILTPDSLYPPVGTDVVVLGDAVAPDGPTEATRVELSVGPYEVALDVFGDRTWETPSRATPAKKFERMPVTYRNAFGGTGKGPYGEIPWHHNPMGKGYAFSPGEVVGKPLPNIESPERHVKSWDDRPDPVGLGPYPVSWGLKLLKVAQFDVAEKKLDLRPEEGMFSLAHPALSGRRVMAGPVRIAGMSAAGTIRFDLPACPFETQITLGERDYVRDLDLQEILLDLRAMDGGPATVELLYRKMFTYEFVPLMHRRTIVRRKLAGNQHGNVA